MNNVKEAVSQYRAFRIGVFVLNLTLGALIVGFGFVPMANILWGISLPFWATYFTFLGVSALLSRLGGVHAVVDAMSTRNVLEDALRGK